VIVLNIAKELTKVENWDDIVTRPGFSTDLNPQEHTLDAIIGRYAFRDKIRCGLSNCHTPHAKGYIVVTKDGRETNIGKDCGRTYFGVDFDALSAIFERDITEKENRDKLWSFSFGIEELKNRIDEIRKQTHGADWVYRQTRPLMSVAKEVPVDVVRRFGDMVKTRQPVLYSQREATAQEVENLEASQGRKIPRPHYLEEAISEIAGLEALYPENDLRTLLVIELVENVKSFEEQDIDTLTYEALRKWSKWTGTIDATLEKSVQAIAVGRRLLTPENLEPFTRILRDADDISRLQKYLKQLR